MSDMYVCVHVYKTGKEWALSTQAEAFASNSASTFDDYASKRFISSKNEAQVSPSTNHGRFFPDLMAE